MLSPVCHLVGRHAEESGLRQEHFLYKVHLCGPLCSQNAVGVGRNVSTLENSCVTYKLDHHTVAYKRHISRNTAITQALQMRLFDAHSTCSKNRKTICPPTLTTVYISSWWLCCCIDHFLHCLGHQHQCSCQCLVPDTLVANKNCSAEHWQNHTVLWQGVDALAGCVVQTVQPASCEGASNISI